MKKYFREWQTSEPIEPTPDEDNTIPKPSGPRL